MIQSLKSLKPFKSFEERKYGEEGYWILITGYY